MRGWPRLSPERTRALTSKLSRLTALTKSMLPTTIVWLDTRPPRTRRCWSTRSGLTARSLCWCLQPRTGATLLRVLQLGSKWIDCRLRRLRRQRTRFADSVQARVRRQHSCVDLLTGASADCDCKTRDASSFCAQRVAHRGSDSPRRAPEPRSALPTD